jgi:protein ImuB
LSQVNFSQTVLNPSTALRAGPAQRLNGLNVLNSPATGVLIRRVHAKPLRLAGGPYHSHEDGWLILGPKQGNIDKLTGPYVFTGGWWNKEIQREYYYAETRGGDLLWLYYDRVRRRWFWQGAVE